MTGAAEAKPLERFSVIVPARNEEEHLGETLRALSQCLEKNAVPYELVPVDDGSTDGTWALLSELADDMPHLRPVQNQGPHGYGAAILCGFDMATGDALTVTMADASDDPEDVVLFWRTLNEGYDCAFGTRWGPGTRVEDYPRPRYYVNRVLNHALRLLFWTRYDDLTNGFKAFRRTVVDGCAPLRSQHFSLALELPLKALSRGYTYKVVPNSWQNRDHGQGKLRLWSSGTQYMGVILRVWMEARFNTFPNRQRDL